MSPLVAPIVASIVALALPLSFGAGCGPRPASAAPEVVDAPLLTPTALDGLVSAYERAGAAYQRSDFAAAATAFREAASFNPGDDSLEYQAATALAQAGRSDEALVALERLAGQGSRLVPQGRDFPAITAARLKPIAAATRRNLPASRSSSAFTLAERDLIPEGITCDPATGTFFVGSMYRRKIVAIDRDGKVRDLVAPAADELYSPLGMRFDARRGTLWVASVALPTMQGFDAASHGGRSALHEIDVTTGRTRNHYARDNLRPHGLNDLVLGPRGEVYVSDSESGELLMLEPGPEAQFEALVPPGVLHYPNGVALSDDAQTVFVADFVHGLTAVRLADRERITLAHPRGVSTHGLDGLYFHRGALIGVDNGAGAGRIVRLELAPAHDRILRAEVLEAGHPAFEIPTTGTILGDDLYYIANSQLRSFEGGKIFPLDRLRPVEVLRLPLTR